MPQPATHAAPHLQTRKGRAWLIAIVETVVAHTFAEELGDYANAKELDILVPLPTLLQHRCKHHGLATARATAAYVLHSAGLYYGFIGAHYGHSEDSMSRLARRFAIRLKREVLLSLRVRAILDAVTVALIATPVPLQPPVISV